jgi:hypothetical protein
VRRFAGLASSYGAIGLVMTLACEARPSKRGHNSERSTSEVRRGSKATVVSEQVCDSSGRVAGYQKEKACKSLGALKTREKSGVEAFWEAMDGICISTQLSFHPPLYRPRDSPSHERRLLPAV